MEKIVHDFIIKEAIFKHGDGVVVGLSGGADSVALLRCLIELSGELGLKLFASHINHNMRGEDSFEDERFCVDLCSKLAVPIKVFSVDVKGYAAEKKLSYEEAGRELRYKAFAEALTLFSADSIATAHNKNDQAETFLMRTIRGTGIKGLCSMRPIAGSLARPFLCVSRTEIENYLESINQPYRTDGSNTSDIYTRNRIRSKLLPLIINELNPSVINAVCRSADILNEENDFIENETDKAYDECNTENGIDITKLNSFHSAIIKRVIRLAYKNWAGTLHDLSAAQTDCVLALITNKTGSVAELVNNCNAVIEYGVLKFADRANVSCEFCYELHLEQPVYIKETGCYAGLTRTARNGIVFDGNKLAGSIHLRSRQNGDKINLDGVGTKKLSDFFTDRKTPKNERDSVPILEVNGEIIFIAGGNNRNAYTDRRFEADETVVNKIYFNYGEEN